MKKAELDQVKLEITNSISTAIAPVAQSVNELTSIVKLHQQTIHGPNGDNGLCGDVKALKVVAEDYKVKKGQLVLVAAAIGGAVSWAAKIIPNPFAK
jgi:hypothetical protein